MPSFVIESFIYTQLKLPNFTIATLYIYQDVATRKASEAQAAERRANSDMEHEALLRLEQVERASTAERAEEEAREATASMELVAESLRARVRIFCFSRRTG